MPPKSPSRRSIVDYLYSGFASAALRLGVRHFQSAYNGAAQVSRSLELDDVIDRYESDLQLLVAEEARSRFFVHSGAVGWKGKAILIPGRRLSGKTTLVAELVRAGATYYSDEYAVLDANGFVHAYEKPLSIRSEPGARQENVRLKNMAAG